MAQEKSLQELTIKHNFMFGAVMSDPKNCKESDEVDMEDGSHTIYLSTHGKNKEEVSEELIAFLNFVRSPLEESEREVTDTYVRQLQDSVRQVKADREMGARYMTLKELIKDERKEAYEEGKLEGRLEGRFEGSQERLLKQIQRKLVKGQSTEQIVEALEEEVEVIEKLIREHL